MASLSGKVAIVTGSSSGIGRAIAERLAEEGAIVVVNYAKRAELARNVVSEIQAKGGTAVALQADMSRATEARRLVTDSHAQFGRLDILVNNAGKFLPKGLMETTETEFDQVFALHAKGPFFAMQEAAKLMKDGGRIHQPGAGGHQLTAAGRCMSRSGKSAGFIGRVHLPAPSA